jgi:hypothetical protein
MGRKWYWLFPYEEGEGLAEVGKSQYNITD